jgi:hypothetical protein
MQKIIEQELGGDEEKAKDIVQYTWEKDEEAFYYCNNYRDVFKVKFTGVRWFLLRKWSSGSKIYQYKYLECSSPERDLLRMGLDYDGISHGNESIFYTTREEALEKGFNNIKRTMDDAIETFNKDNFKLIQYKNKN